MLAGGCGDWQVDKLPNSTTSRNAERQKVLPPPASSCHSLPKWRSSPEGTLFELGPMRLTVSDPLETCHLMEFRFATLSLATTSQFPGGLA